MSTFPLHKLESAKALASYIVISSTEKYLEKQLRFYSNSLKEQQQQQQQQETCISFSQSCILFQSSPGTLHILSVGYYIMDLLSPEQMKELLQNGRISLRNNPKLLQNFEYSICIKRNNKSNNTNNNTTNTNNNNNNVILNDLIIVQQQQQQQEEIIFEIIPEYLWLDKDLCKFLMDIYSKNKAPYGLLDIDKHIEESAIKNLLLISFRLKTQNDYNIIKMNSGQIPQLIQNPRIPYHGQTIYSLSSPFAILSEELYKNVLTKGIVSNIKFINGYQQKIKYMFTIDNFNIDGSQGGAIFDENLEFLGIIFTFVSQKDTNQRDMQLCIGVNDIIEHIKQISNNEYNNKIQQQITNNINNNNNNNKVQSQPNLSNVKSRVVAIITQTSWGSGVLINSNGYILTTQHVIKRNEPYIYIKVPGDSTFHEAYVFKASDGDVDICLLKMAGPVPINDSQPFFPEKDVAPFLLGTDIYTVGYGLFQPNTFDSPSVTVGNLSSIVPFDGKPFLIQTNCKIFNGYSGGAIVSKDGLFLGIMAFSVKLNGHGIINNLNFGYSYSTLAHVIELIRCREVEKVKKLNIWSLKNKFIDDLNNLQTRHSIPSFKAAPKL